MSKLGHKTITYES